MCPKCLNFTWFVFPTGGGFCLDQLCGWWLDVDDDDDEGDC